MYDDLTQEQKKGITEMREKWLAASLSTKPADRIVAEQGAIETYKAAGLRPPEKFIWVGSPFSGMVAANVVEEASEKDLPNIEKMVEEAVALRKEADYRYVGSFITGQHQGPVMAVYEYMYRYLDYEEAHKLEGQFKISSSAGWWWPYEHVVILCERPKHIHRNQNRDLHAESGPTLEYPDEYKTYHWNGVRVPHSLVERGWSTEEIFREQNAEIRRCAIEKIGWDNFVEQAELKQTGKTVDDPGNPGKKLSLYTIPEDIFEEEVSVVLCTNGTQERDGTHRRFGITTRTYRSNGTKIEDPVEAIATTYGTNKEEYASLVRRA